MAILQGTYGPLAATADGGTSLGIRLDRTGAIVHVPGRAANAEQATRTLLYAACIPPGTGQAPGTAIGTTGCFVLGNPAGSGVNLVLIELSVGYISGTLGAGVLALLAHVTSPPITAPSGGTPITPQNMLLGSAQTAAANCRFNATVPATGTMIRAIANLGAGLASTAAFPSQVVDKVNGAVVIGPGTAVSVQGIAAAGSCPLIVVGAVWAEETYP